MNGRGISGTVYSAAEHSLALPPRATRTQKADWVVLACATRTLGFLLALSNNLLDKPGLYRHDNQASAERRSTEPNSNYETPLPPPPPIHPHDARHRQRARRGAGLSAWTEPEQQTQHRHHRRGRTRR